MAGQDQPAHRRKPVNLPRIRPADIDLRHILDGHREGGSRVGSAKTLFPSGWSDDTVALAILKAHRAGKRVLTQGVRVKVRGETDGVIIEMWVNMENRRIETAYPV